MGAWESTSHTQSDHEESSQTTVPSHSVHASSTSGDSRAQRAALRISPYSHSVNDAHNVRNPLLDTRARSSHEQPNGDGATEVKDTMVVKNPVNVGKKSLTVIRDRSKPNVLAIEFRFDAICPAVITLHFCAIETFDPLTHQLKFVSEHSSTPRYVPAGMSQNFRTTGDESLDLLRHQLKRLQFKPQAESRNNVYPIVIELVKAAADSALNVTNSLQQPDLQSHYTYASLKMIQPETGANSDRDWVAVSSTVPTNWGIDVIGQKIQCGRGVFVVHEIYGIETVNDDGGEDGTRQECVICLSEERNTTVLPCRHMCLCASCADIMRMSSNKCPVCRQYVTGLLQLTLKRKASS